MTLSKIISAIHSFLRQALLFPIRLYRLIHPYFFSGVCRFTPTCSAYAIEAIETHGIFKGVALGFYRILRCNPFCKGGYEPVPPRKESL